MLTLGIDMLADVLVAWGIGECLDPVRTVKPFIRP